MAACIAMLEHQIATEAAAFIEHRNLRADAMSHVQSLDHDVLDDFDD
jgi:hypothetical protein